MNPYESDELLSQYLLLHYGSEEDTLGDMPAPRAGLNFPRRCVSELIGPMERDSRALDVGCAVGRASFELARYASSVIGIDFSRRFIAAAETLKAEGSCEGTLVIEGDLTASFTASVPVGIDRERVNFEVGDAMNIREDIGVFDVVVAANLLCRMPDPKRFLDRVPEIVKPGGQLLLTTPFTWTEEFTPRANWLVEDGKRSFDVLKEILAPHFELQVSKDLPFLIREHERKFQCGIALGSRWIRR